MIGLFPLVRNKAFDMVSDGDEFKLSIPPKSKFYVGHNDVARPVLNPLENLRPSVIYNALLIPEINGTDQIAVLEYSTETVVIGRARNWPSSPITRWTCLARPMAPGSWRAKLSSTAPP